MKKALLVLLVSLAAFCPVTSRAQEATAADLDELKAKTGKVEALYREAEMSANKSTFSRASSPTRFYGYFTARYQNVTGFGAGECSHSAMEEFLALWLDGAIAEFKYKLLLSLERPGDDGTEIPAYWSTGRVFLDEFALETEFQKTKLSVGSIWVNTILLSNILTDRPMLFEKDIYQSSDVGTKSKYDIAFLSGDMPKDQRWSKVYLMGGTADIEAFGRKIKATLGKAKNFYSDYSPSYRYLTDGFLELGSVADIFGIINRADASVEFFNLSNVYSEILGLGGSVDAAKENNTVYLAEANLKALDSVSVNLRYARSFYNNRNFSGLHGDLYSGTLRGNVLEALFGLNAPMSVQFFRVEPDYTAIYGNVGDTRKRGDSDLEILDNNFTDISDTTLLMNNTQGLMFTADFKIPNVLTKISYGYRKQIKATGPEVVNSHFLNGQPLNGAMWWHQFFSSYGNAIKPRDDNWFNYNETYADSMGNTGAYRYILTSGWRNNQEVVVLDETEKSCKEWSNINADFRFNIGKMAGMGQSLYLQLYSELSALDVGGAYFPSYSAGKLFVTSINDAVLAYNIIDPVNVILETGLEVWKSNRSKGFPVDYQYITYGAGLEWDAFKNIDVYVRFKSFDFQDMVKRQNDFTGYSVFTELKSYF